MRGNRVTAQRIVLMEISRVQSQRVIYRFVTVTCKSLSATMHWCKSSIIKRHLAPVENTKYSYEYDK